MRAEERRQAIRELLQNSKQPVSASALAARFAVSRQIIVGDIALLRAAGAEIFRHAPGVCDPAGDGGAWCGRWLSSTMPPAWRRS